MSLKGTSTPGSRNYIAHWQCIFFNRMETSADRYYSTSLAVYSGDHVLSLVWGTELSMYFNVFQCISLSKGKFITTKEALCFFELTIKLLNNHSIFYNQSW
jgi:hypothetical protein